MEAKLAGVVGECRVELVGSMDPAAIDNHHDLFVCFAEGRHHLMEILAQLLGIKVGHDFREDFGGAILDRPNDTEQHAAGDTAPGAIPQPRVAFEGFVACDLTLAQGAEREARTLGCAPPAGARQGKAPEDGFVFIEPNDLATASPVLQGGKFERAIGESSRVGIKTTSGAVVAYFVFFNAQRTLSRLSWTPVCWAKTVVSSRQFHWEWMVPYCRGS